MINIIFDYKKGIFSFIKSALFLMVCLLSACERNQQITTADSNGKTINLSDYHGKWVVLNYWASWCKPCQIEIPELNAFNASHQNRDAVVISVNFDHVDSQKLQQLVQKFSINYPVLIADPGPKLGINNVPGLPASYLINPEGKVVKSLYGEQTQKELELAMNLSDRKS